MTWEGAFALRISKRRFRRDLGRISGNESYFDRGNARRHVPICIEVQMCTNLVDASTLSPSLLNCITICFLHLPKIKGEPLFFGRTAHCSLLFYHVPTLILS